MARRLVLPMGLTGAKSLWFDGVDDAVTGVGAPLSGNQAATFAMWVRMNRHIPNYQIFFLCGSYVAGKGILIGASAKRYYIEHCGISGYSASNILTGFWVRIVLTYNTNKDVKFYVGGAWSSTVTLSSTVDFTGSAYFGTCPNLLGYPPACNLSDVRIYNRVWTPEEAAADALGEWVSDTGLVRRWTCENPGSGATCHEEIGNTDDAISGALWSTDVVGKVRSIA